VTMVKNSAHLRSPPARGRAADNSRRAPTSERDDRLGRGGSRNRYRQALGWAGRATRASAVPPASARARTRAIADRSSAAGDSSPGLPLGRRRRPGLAPAQRWRHRCSRRARVRQLRSIGRCLGTRLGSAILTPNGGVFGCGAPLGHAGFGVNVQFCNHGWG